MNCKPGDLAVIVGRAGLTRECDLPYIGRIVECIEFDGEAWSTEPELDSLDCHGMVVEWYDAELSPLRDNDGEDEMLRIAGKPQEKETV